MAIPNKILPGFSAALYLQSGSNPTPLTTTQLSTLASVAAIAVSCNLLAVEGIPAFGQDDASANFGVAGSRQSDIIPTQSKPTSMTINAAWNPSDTGLLLIRADAYSGTIDRTYVIAVVSGATTIAYAFNGRVGEFKIETPTNAEAKCTFTIHPRGNQYGWSNT